MTASAVVVHGSLFDSAGQLPRNNLHRRTCSSYRSSARRTSLGELAFSRTCGRTVFPYSATATLSERIDLVLLRGSLTRVPRRADGNRPAALTPSGL